MKTREQTKRLQKRRLRKRLGTRRRIKSRHPCPRLTVYRSSRNISVQIVDDEIGRTLVSVSTLEKSLGDETSAVTKVEAAKKAGELLAARARAAGIAKVRFDRGCYKFHGRVKALADAAREGGLVF